MEGKHAAQVFLLRSNRVAPTLSKAFTARSAGLKTTTDTNPTQDGFIETLTVACATSY